MQSQTLIPRLVKITTRNGIDIRRTLPHKRIRMIGAWCFVDHYGPTDQKDAMSIAAHPHAGLQTVSWLFSGKIEHRDSLGSIQNISPGELNLMTAGRGIAHSELSIDESAPVHGVQLWTALPDKSRRVIPAFAHHENLPFDTFENFSIKVLMGTYMNLHSPAITYSPLLGAEIAVTPQSAITFPLNSDFEHGFLIVEGTMSINGVQIPSGNLHYMSAGLKNVNIETVGGAKAILLGGAPFEEDILMWWNFIARSQEEIEDLRQEWNSRSPNIPVFEDRIGGWIPAPEMPNVRLAPRRNR